MLHGLILMIEKGACVRPLLFWYFCRSATLYYRTVTVHDALMSTRLRPTKQIMNIRAANITKMQRFIWIYPFNESSVHILEIIFNFIVNRNSEFFD